MTPQENEYVAAVKQLVEIERSGDYVPAQVMMGPYSAFLLISVVQLSTRHPEMSGEIQKIVTNIARTIQSNFEGKLYDLLEKGWDPGQDYPAGTGIRNG